MLVAPHQSKAEYILTTMNEMKICLQLVSYLFKVAPYWSVIVLSTFLQLFNVKPPKCAVHQQASKLFQQHGRHLKGNYDLKPAFENGDRLLEQKAYRQSVSVYCATNIIKPTCDVIYRKNYFNSITNQRSPQKIRSNHTCQQYLNPSSETVLLNTFYRARECM